MRVEALTEKSLKTVGATALIFMLIFVLTSCGSPFARDEVWQETEEMSALSAEAAETEETTMLSAGAEGARAEALSESGTETVSSSETAGSVAAPSDSAGSATELSESAGTAAALSETEGQAAKDRLTDGDGHPLLIAHAGGAVRTAERVSTYTNSLEAFESNYALGHRYFEVDLMETSDGDLAAVHDWNNYGGRDGTALSSAEWKELRASGRKESEGRYTPLLLEDLLVLMQTHPDLYLITDTKYNDERTVHALQLICERAELTDASLLDRIIPQIYGNDMYEEVMALYPWTGLIYTTYATSLSAEEIIGFCCDREGIFAITVKSSDSRFGAEAVTAVHEAGLLLYRYTVDSYAKMTTLSAAGSDGFYTNTLLPRDLALLLSLQDP